MSFTTLLVANRGEIACRIMRTARELGLKTVAVFTDADAGAPHVLSADDSVRIGSGSVGESYLSIPAIMEAARVSGAQAVHPGYGFLSENAAFAQACADAGLVFVGPPVAAIAAMGNKAAAKRLMLDAGVPCVPGYQGVDQSDEALENAVGEIGYPVMVKAAAGGGGRGMRLVENATALKSALAAARSEALNAFGSDELIIERAVLRPRHVEIQVFADHHGNCIHLGERDCSVQRRHQKVVEEAPSPAVSPQLRERMGAAAVEAARAVGYAGAGTVEFLLDADGGFHFLEMNTRLQVEHPVTEMVTGLDLVAMQIAVAQGEPLPLRQHDVTMAGHAMEVRLYAEDPANDFLPAAGKIALWNAPQEEGVRVDAGIAAGQQISSHYDPMLAKIIAHGATREIALRKLSAAVGRTALLGVTTNRDFLMAILDAPAFRDGSATTGFIAEMFGDEGFSRAAPTFVELAIAAALLYRHRQGEALAASADVSPHLAGWASTGFLRAHLDLQSDAGLHRLTITERDRALQIAENGRHGEITQICVDGASATLRVDGRKHHVIHCIEPDRILVSSGSRDLVIGIAGSSSGGASAAGEDGIIRAPMHGQVVECLVSEGDRIVEGQAIAVLEAMKMQHPVHASIAGQVIAVHVKPGAQVAVGEAIAEIGQEQGS